MNGAGRAWATSSLATKINQIFVRQRTESSIILTWKEENLGERNTEEESEEEKDDDLGQVRRSNSEQEGTTVRCKRNSILVQTVHEVFTATVNERSDNDKEDHLCNGNNDSVQLRHELEQQTSRRTKKGNPGLEMMIVYGCKTL
jgi:hypothetical protein